ncbi:hypothetical protein MFUM_940078 [Methylacidiphilum fumariolicum SolV]|uniref:Uncharacterized protein n=2 Tax=Candidatus Methylacidiphilum fumarolicum TaxID=591154 RepID=I0K134_METFB|nr:conserved protein of unknown function [Candidatus Methylacidiphilum fumarolicum]CCG93203.1 hypothetical protein MFUM_940078 [Methylacidiphilum fumariolicum SolV]
MFDDVPSPLVAQATQMTLVTQHELGSDPSNYHHHYRKLCMYSGFPGPSPNLIGPLGQ